jgi:hypothetical protein
VDVLLLADRLLLHQLALDVRCDRLDIRRPRLISEGTDRSERLWKSSSRTPRATGTHRCFTVGPDVSIVRGDRRTIGSSVEFDRHDVQKGGSFGKIDRGNEQDRQSSQETERGDMTTIPDTAR